MSFTIYGATVVARTTTDISITDTQVYRVLDKIEKDEQINTLLEAVRLRVQSHIPAAWEATVEIKL